MMQGACFFRERLMYAGHSTVLAVLRDGCYPENNGKKDEIRRL